MKLSKVSLTNYRCFEQFDLLIPPKGAILVGDNGSGKSTILDGLSIGLASFFLGMEGTSSGNIHKNDVRVKTFELGSRMERQAQYPARVECQGTIGEQTNTWFRSLNTAEGKTTYGGANALIKTAEEMMQRIQKGDASVMLPILSYYGTGRLWAKKREKRETAKVNLNSRFAGYADCLDAMSNDKLMYKWFEQMTYMELQEQRPIPELEAVKQAVLECFNHSGNADILTDSSTCQYNVKTSEIEITYKKSNGELEVHALSEMSDGYRNMLSMVADIAYRMALLNPQLLDRVTKETEGVVLIDEIDLHLHPSWQRHIVATLRKIFPKVQFIVSTHSPSVIASVNQEEIIIIKNYSPVISPFHTYGKDVNAILKTVMDVPERQDDVQKLIDSFHEAVAEGRTADAQDHLKRLSNILGDNDPEVVGAETALTLEMME